MIINLHIICLNGALPFISIKLLPRLICAGWSVREGIIGKLEICSIRGLGVKHGFTCKRILDLTILSEFPVRAEDIFSLISIRSDDVAKVCVFHLRTSLIAWLWKPLRTRVQQDLSVDVISDNNLEGKKNKAGLLVDIFGDQVELLVSIHTGNLDAIELILLARPVIIEPAPILI